jgi:hypothetical protein
MFIAGDPMARRSASSGRYVDKMVTSAIVGPMTVIVTGTRPRSTWAVAKLDWIVPVMF